MKVALVGGESRTARALLRFAGAQSLDIGFRVFARRPTGIPGSSREHIQVEDYFEIDSAALSECEALINFVGTPKGTETTQSKINAELPVRLLAESLTAGIRYFIQISSLSVHGAAENIARDTRLRPLSAYGRSKLDAEQGLLSFEHGGTMKTAVLRLPTIYGYLAPSKLSRLARLLDGIPVMPVPRPLPSRSVISEQNVARVLLELLATRLSGVHYAADPEPFRLDQFVALLPHPPRLVSVPRFALQPFALLAPSLYSSLFTSSVIAEECLFRPASYPLEETRLGLLTMISACLPSA